MADILAHLTAAQAFHHVLVLASGSTLKVLGQDEPYGTVRDPHNVTRVKRGAYHSLDCSEQIRLGV